MYYNLYLYIHITIIYNNTAILFLSYNYLDIIITYVHINVNMTIIIHKHTNILYRLEDLFDILYKLRMCHCMAALGFYGKQDAGCSSVGMAGKLRGWHARRKLIHEQHIGRICHHKIFVGVPKFI